MKNKKSTNLLYNTLSQSGYWILSKKLVREIGLEPAFVLSDLISKQHYFMERKMLEKDGSFYNTGIQQRTDCNISKRMLIDSIKVLQQRGLIRVEKRGSPPRNYFYINDDAILNFLTSEDNHQEYEDLDDVDLSANSDCTNSTNKKAQTEQTNCPNWDNGSSIFPNGTINFPKWDNQFSQMGQSIFPNGTINFPKWDNSLYSNKNKEEEQRIKTKEGEQRPPEAATASPAPSFSILKVNSPSEIKEFARRARDVLLRKTPKSAANNSYKVEDQVVAFTEIIFGDLPYEWWKFENGKRKSQPGKVPPVAYPWDFNTTEKFDMLSDLATEWLKKPKVFFEKSEWTPESYQNVVIENLRECLFNNDSYLPPNEQSEKNRKAKQEIEIDKQKSQEISKALDNMKKIEEAKRNGELDPTKWTVTPEELVDADRAGMSMFNMKKIVPCVEGYVYDFIDDLVAVGKAEMPDSFKHPEWVEGFMIAITDAITARPEWTWKNPECKTPLEALHAYVRQCKMDAED